MADSVSKEAEDKNFPDIKGLKPWLVRDLKKLGILRPTPVQLACIPPALKGMHVLGGAETGSGKTLAFVLPILNKLSDDPYGIFALVLTPTRELAHQIADQVRAVGASMGVRVTVVVGGEDRFQQSRELQQEPHVVVATPGRLSDLLSDEKDFTLKKIKFLVLDEADRLLDGRFEEQMSIVMNALPAQRQTLLFSATVSEDIEVMEKTASGPVFRWEASTRGEVETTVSQLEELYALVNPKVRDTALVSYLLQWQHQHPEHQAIIFVDTCLAAETLGRTLQQLDLKCVILHSYKPQKERLEALARFKGRQSRIMMATDIAARGLDIPAVALVVNHRMPNSAKTYLHRVGRTARAGRGGTALTIVTPEDQQLLMSLEARNPRKLTQYKLDNVLIRRLLKQVSVVRREQEILLEEEGFHETKLLRRRRELILQGLDPDEELANLAERIRRGQQKRRQRFLKASGEQVGEAGEPATPGSVRAREKALLKQKKNHLRKAEADLSKGDVSLKRKQVPLESKDAGFKRDEHLQKKKKKKLPRTS